MQIEPTEFQDQLVRGLTHRMNNILTLFHGYVGLLLDNQHLDSATKHGLCKIQDGARAATELIDRTHSLARPSALIWREVNLADFIRMLRPSFETMRGPRTKLTLDLPDDIPPVWADAARAKTAIVEIVRNALEATAAGGAVKITLRAASPPVGMHPVKPLRWVQVTVADEGPGIPPELTEKIFHPFFSTRRKQNSTGLGLTVAAGFMQQLGGVLRFTSEPKNTVFHLLLPSRAELS